MDARCSMLFDLSARKWSIALLIHLYRHFQILVLQSQSQILQTSLTQQSKLTRDSDLCHVVMMFLMWYEES